MPAQRRNWVIWSYEHDAWWRPARSGYTKELAEAGRYSFEEAQAIVIDANRHVENKGSVNECMMTEDWAPNFRKEGGKK